MHDMKWRRVRSLLVAASAAIALAVSPVADAVAAVPAPTQGSLQPLSIDSVYASGVSSGGFLANQLHVAHSEIFKGVGIFSAGPYDCAQGGLTTALYACMDTLLPRKTPAQLEQETRDRAASGGVDPVANLSGAPVWLSHGSSDKTVDRTVNDDLATYYRDFGANVSYDTASSAGHAWVSPLGEVSCTSTASPYVNNCGGDPEKDMLTHLFGSVRPATTTALTGRLVQFDQNAYAPGQSASAVSMGNEGFAYIPQSCATGTSCKLMVALHGCYQYYGLIGDKFMAEANLNEYADTNNMVVLYPQATTASDNPRGCWNWWAYGGDTHYAEKSGRQITAITNMVNAIAGPPTAPALPAPTGVTATGTTTNSISLTWNAVAGAASYNVYRDGSKANAAPLDGTTYTDSGLASGTAYTYTVAAVENSGTVGARSAPVTVTTTTATTPLPNCWTTDNVSHNLAGRSYFIGDQSYAIGTGQYMGPHTSTAVSSLHLRSPGSWEVVPHC
ncbi:extracellular catalytic domain type 2 short-chain-length polyhydroxyalkanoate depolymerase [Streptomyces sp. BR1]|uniref:extracellular catalytic domain type 2 short-chain-length polyhydroxyalkanoate depolymerase n=1 Tax=Streptomyces sp. BR1 TaxID=1592323 RepID=UPI00402B2FC9